MHRPVLKAEVLDGLNIRPDGRYVDGTIGGAGHAEGILERLGAEGALLGIDRDADAVARSRERLAGWGARCRVVQGNFADVETIVQGEGWDAVDGILLDLGVSSFQVEDAERGFSFQRDGPLDMRADRSQGMTAADFINTAGEDSLAGVLRTLGEEPAARRIARAIVADRAEHPFRTTGQLADLVARVKGGRIGRLHPATLAFQALRMEVNRETENLERGLAGALRLLRRGGRLAVIAFHRIEDRIAKSFFQLHRGRWESLQEGGQRWVGEEPRVSWIFRKAVSPSPDEVEENPRARSARLRVVERTT